MFWIAQLVSLLTEAMDSSDSDTDPPADSDEEIVEPILDKEWRAYVKNSTDLSDTMKSRHGRRGEATFPKLNRFRASGTLCDATISVGARKFSVHKIVLAAYSSYFCTMFTGPFDEKTEACIEIRGISESVFNDLLEYMYGTRLRLNFGNVAEIFTAADMLCVDAVVDECKLYFGLFWPRFPELSVVYQMAKEMRFKETTDVISEGVRSALPLSKLRECSFEFLCEVLEGRSFNKTQIAAESRLADKLVDWTFHKVEERLPRSLELFSRLRFEFLSLASVKDMLVTCDYACQDAEGDLSLLQVLTTGLEDLYKQSHAIISGQNIQMVIWTVLGNVVVVFIFDSVTWEWASRSCYVDFIPKYVLLNHDDLYVFGRVDGVKMNMRTQGVVKLPAFPDTRGTKATFVFVGNTLYVIGGEHDFTEEPYHEMLELKPDSKHWSIHEDLPELNDAYSVVGIGECLYFVGVGPAKRDISKYDCASRTFGKLCELPGPVEQLKLVVTYEGSILVFRRIYSFEQIDVTTGKVAHIYYRFDDRETVLAACAVKDGFVIATRNDTGIWLHLVKPTAAEKKTVLGVVYLPTVSGEIGNNCLSLRNKDASSFQTTSF